MDKTMHLALSSIIFASLALIISSTLHVKSQSIYSPFYVNETAEAEKNRIEFETYNNPKYGFSIDHLKGATIDDKLNIEELSEIYDLEGREITFRGGGPPHLGPRFSSFDIYLNDSINMERYIQRDLQGNPLMKGTEYETKVIDSGTPITVAGLQGKSIKFRLPVLDVIKEGAYFIDGNHTYHIEYTDNPFFYRDEIFDHIVNSFKFIPIVEDVNSGISSYKW